MLHKVLITQGTRPFAQRIARLLFTESTVLFGTADEVPAVLLQTGNYLRIASPNRPTFIHEMLKACLDNEVDVLIPLGKNELYPLAEAKQLFAEYGVTVWVPDTADLQELTIIENPPKQFALLALQGGVAVADPQHVQRYGSLSGIFVPSDSGEEMALCCVAELT